MKTFLKVWSVIFVMFALWTIVGSGSCAGLTVGLILCLFMFLVLIGVSVIWVIWQAFGALSDGKETGKASSGSHDS